MHSLLKNSDHKSIRNSDHTSSVKLRPYNQIKLRVFNMREFQNHFTESMEQLHLQTTIKTLIFILWQCCNLINNQTSLSYQASWCQVVGSPHVCKTWKEVH
uniref:Uncharacterized protein n=1 Tax=Helianthus annuus TaxID=4232 RepID=A0A251RTS4_HELAN